jgi:hypothetical protein
VSKKTDKKKKLEIKKETLRKLELTPEDLKRAGGGLLNTDPPGTYPSARVC